MRRLVIIFVILVTRAWGDVVITPVGTTDHYPEQGDEYISVKYEEKEYHLKVLHPKVLPGPHYSAPFMWISHDGGEIDYASLYAGRAHVGGFSWMSTCGYFFVLDEIVGFLTIDGRDTAEWGAMGCLYYYERGEPFTLRWSYSRDPEKERGKYTLFENVATGEKASRRVRKMLKPVLERAERDAGAWPGP